MSDLTRMPPPLRWFAWAAFLACSWTWCIGMYLPGILVRDFGVAGWVVFAVPNVLGAAAMGYVFPSRGDSARFVRRHGTACAVFSWVTAAFQAYWLAWFAPQMLDQVWVLPVLVAVTGLALLAACPGVAAGVVLWLLSAALALAAWRGAGLAQAAPWPVPTRTGLDLLWLAPVIAFGFLLCPYLDLSFHRACQNNDAPGRRAAFSLGFAGLFLAMIAFSLLYAPLQHALWSWGEGDRRDQRLLLTLLLVHLVAQAMFTLGVHLREIRRRRPSGGAAALLGVPLLAAGLGLACAMGRVPWLGEAVYRGFMGFYGLVFPAYVWACVIVPAVTGRSDDVAGPRRRLALAVAVLPALPLFALGFLGSQTLWLVPGIVLALGLPVLVIRPRRGEASPAASGPA